MTMQNIIMNSLGLWGSHFLMDNLSEGNVKGGTFNNGGEIPGMY